MKDKFEEIESSQRQHNELLLFDEKRYQLHVSGVLNTFATLKPKLYKDGDMWCCLMGENIQAGISGFGKSPFLAMAEFNENLHKGT